MKLWPFKKKPINLCKDCKWCIKLDYCTSPKVCELSLIDGRPLGIYVEPARILKCGKRAKYFEAKGEV